MTSVDMEFLGENPVLGSQCVGCTKRSIVLKKKYSDDLLENVEERLMTNLRRFDEGCYFQYNNRNKRQGLLQKRKTTQFCFPWRFSERGLQIIRRASTILKRLMYNLDLIYKGVGPDTRIIISRDVKKAQWINFLVKGKDMDNRVHKLNLPQNTLPQNELEQRSLPGLQDEEKNRPKKGDATNSGPKNSITIASKNESFIHDSDKSSMQKKRKNFSKDVFFGDLVKEGHQNYVLMYDMLTGIRVAVSRCQAKVPRALTDMDFKAANKVAFDIIGNELAPSSLYDFKFKDYAPWAFREIRKNFRVDPAEYLLSLTNKYILSERCSPGKSGSFFYYSADYRFIIKTINWSEYRFLRKFLQSYFEHVSKYPNTLIVRILGLHRVKMHRNKKIHFIVMDNILPPNKIIHALYDLKGSLHGRRATPEEKAKNPHTCVYKDYDWIESKCTLKLGPIRREIFLRQLGADINFLANHDIMDYSLLVGIHDAYKAADNTARHNRISVFQPDTKFREDSFNSPRETEVGRRERAKAFKSVISATNPITMVNDVNLFPPRDNDNCKKFTFYMDDGGFKCTDSYNQVGNEIYYVGIIDIFTKFGSLKRIENAWKSIRYKKSDISAVNPQYYSKRLLTFISRNIS